MMILAWIPAFLGDLRVLPTLILGDLRVPTLTSVFQMMIPASLGDLSRDL